MVTPINNNPTQRTRNIPEGGAKPNKDDLSSAPLLNEGDSVSLTPAAAQNSESSSSIISDAYNFFFGESFEPSNYIQTPNKTFSLNRHEGRAYVLSSGTNYFQLEPTYNYYTDKATGKRVENPIFAKAEKNGNEMLFVEVWRGAAKPNGQRQQKSDTYRDYMLLGPNGGVIYTRIGDDESDAESVIINGNKYAPLRNNRGELMKVKKSDCNAFELMLFEFAFHNIDVILNYSNRDSMICSSSLKEDIYSEVKRIESNSQYEPLYIGNEIERYLGVFPYGDIQRFDGAIITRADLIAGKNDLEFQIRDEMAKENPDPYLVGGLMRKYKRVEGALSSTTSFTYSESLNMYALDQREFAHVWLKLLKDELPYGMENDLQYYEEAVERFSIDTPQYDADLPVATQPGVIED